MTLIPTVRRALHGGLVLLALGVLSACGGSKPLTVNMTIVGTPDLNMGNAAVVRIYELTNGTNFRQVTPESFWQDDKAALGAELLGDPVQILLYPDQMEALDFEPRGETRFIGVAADLREPDQERWRQLYDVEDVRGKRVMIQVGEDFVTINVQ